MTRRVVITGMGLVTPLGHDVETVWQKLLTGASGVARTTHFNASTFPSTFSGEVKDFDLADFLGDRAQKHKGASRNSLYALGACAQAWKAAGSISARSLIPPASGSTSAAGKGRSTSSRSLRLPLRAATTPQGR